MATADEQKARMTSGELLELVRSKLAEVEAYITTSSRRRHLLVNLVITGSILATALTAPAAVGGSAAETKASCANPRRLDSSIFARIPA